MFARVSIYDIPQDRKGEAQANFSSALARIRETEGNLNAHFLLGCDSDRGITITFWESRQTMAASRTKASGLRSDAASSVGGDVVSVEEFEVVPEGVTASIDA
jgi:heme-degrading monooxygenase HmoA